MTSSQTCPQDAELLALAGFGRKPDDVVFVTRRRRLIEDVTTDVSRWLGRAKPPTLGVSQIPWPRIARTCVVTAGREPAV
jgi:hypothetical protein